MITTEGNKINVFSLMNDFIDVTFEIKGGKKKFDKACKILENAVDDWFDEENEDEFLYAYILWFSVNPKKIGIGSLIINEIIEVLKHLTNIEFIIIHPKDKEVKKFWIKNKFIEDQKLNSDKRININTRRILSYQI